MSTASKLQGLFLIATFLATTCQAGVEYPGTQPGKGAIECQGECVALKNAAISMSWAVDKQGIRPTSLRDQQASQKLALGGEAFQIVMADGQCYAASALVLDGKPRVKELKPNAKAARLAARIPGRQVEATLRPADGRLRVVWRAIIHDDANYVRQEIAVTALKDGCVIKEIDWMGEAVPGARVAGRTDGSPVVAGNLFFGCEDPHAIAAVEPRVSFRLQRNAPLRKGETVTQSLVTGVAPAGQMRRAFLATSNASARIRIGLICITTPGMTSRGAGGFSTKRRAWMPSGFSASGSSSRTTSSWTGWCSTTVGTTRRHSGNSTAASRKASRRWCRPASNTTRGSASGCRPSAATPSGRNSGSSSAASRATRSTPPVSRWPGRNTTARSNSRA